MMNLSLAPHIEMIEKVIKEFGEVYEDYNNLIKKLKIENTSLLNKVTNLRVENEKLEKILSGLINSEKNLSMLLENHKSYFDRTRIGYNQSTPSFQINKVCKCDLC